jgi:glycosyltransferase involved in cell wall biosynthesis
MVSKECPLITFALICYNQDAYIEQALRAALSQTYQPLEIIISDDASSDRTAMIIRKVISAYHGPHQIIINENKKNLGIGAHINKIFSLARGELVVLAAGDDISDPERTAEVVNFWLKGKRTCRAIFCAARGIDEYGADLGSYPQAIRKGLHDPAQAILRIHRPPLLLKGACAAYSTEVMSRFGSLNPNLVVEDTPLTIRATLLGNVAYVARELVLYRVNTSSWVARRTPGETFERLHRRKLEHETIKHAVFIQVLKDIRKVRKPELEELATRRLAANAYILRCLRQRKFSLSGHIRTACFTHEWKEILLYCTLYSLPSFYKHLFTIKQWAAGHFIPTKKRA